MSIVIKIPRHWRRSICKNCGEVYYSFKPHSRFCNYCKEEKFVVKRKYRKFQKHLLYHAFVYLGLKREKSRINSLEIKFDTEIKKLNVKYIRDTYIEYIRYTRPDFYFPESKLFLFLDGCYWHACPICNISKKYHTRYKQDIIKRMRLRKEGFQVLSFWEHEINDNLEDCMLKLKSLIY